MYINLQSKFTKNEKSSKMAKASKCPKLDISWKEKKWVVENCIYAFFKSNTNGFGTFGSFKKYFGIWLTDEGGRIESHTGGDLYFFATGRGLRESELLFLFESNSKPVG